MRHWGIWCLVSLLIAGTAASDEMEFESTLVVTATAYNSHAEQTSAEPNTGAWGDRIEPGMQVIAVSRDLLELGLTRGTEVEVEGLPGTWRVLDKMDQRWQKRIDLYMGKDAVKARRWGVRKVRIYW